MDIIIIKEVNCGYGFQQGYDPSYIQICITTIEITFKLCCNGRNHDLFTTIVLKKPINNLIIEECKLIQHIAETCCGGCSTVQGIRILAEIIFNKLNKHIQSQNDTSNEGWDSNIEAIYKLLN